MKKLLLTLALMVLGSSAFAATDVNVVISSAIPSRVVVTSGTATGAGATRVDNWNRGNQCTTTHCLMASRVSVCLQNMDTADDIFCGWTSSVSSDTATSPQGSPGTQETGTKVGPTELYCTDANRDLQVHCKAEDDAGAAGVLIKVDQLGKSTP